jgi:fructose-bisphosphate aldolase class I
MNLKALEQTALAMVAAHRGILAADESNATIEKRFKGPGIPCTEENRRAYRELLFSTPGMEKQISGVIMYDETIRQKTKDGLPFPKYLADKGVVPGIKVDKGTKVLVNFEDETITEGLDGLRERLAEYHALGARFAKWRAVITIGKASSTKNGGWLLPTTFAIDANAHALARYAALCQEAGIVPIVEPEVLMDGDNDLARCEEVTDAVLESVFDALGAHRIHLEGMVLKPNMVISGIKCPTQASVEEVAAATVRCLKRHVPAAVPGIAFLSGGQSSELATAHLSAMNALLQKSGGAPWHLTFSYGRALQDGAIKTWKGEAANLAKAQAWFAHRALMNSTACDGKYSAAMEKQLAA